MSCFLGIRSNILVIEELGQDAEDKEIELLFGATDMQVWNIHIDLEQERRDLSKFRKEFIEYKENSF